jgi:hypothetical protein
VRLFGCGNPVIGRAKANVRNAHADDRRSRVRLTASELVDLINERTTHGGRHDSKSLLREMAVTRWDYVRGFHVYPEGGGNRVYATVRIGGLEQEHVYLDCNGCVSNITRGSRRIGVFVNRVRAARLAPGVEPPPEPRKS